MEKIHNFGRKCHMQKEKRIRHSENCQSAVHFLHIFS